MKTNQTALLLLAATAASLGGAMVLSRKTLVLYPSPQSHAFPVTDSADDGGRSVLRYLGPSPADPALLEVVYTLQPGFAWPYAGVGLGWKDSLRCPDLSGYAEMAVTLRSSDSRGFIVTLHTVPPDSVRKRTGEAWRLSTQDIPASREPRTVAIPLSGFSMPDWWKARHGLPPDERDVHFGAACRFHLISAKHLAVGSVDTLRIARWEAAGRNPWILGSGLVLPLLAWSGFLLGLWKGRLAQSWRREADLRRREPLEVGNEEDALWEKVRDHAARHYPEPDLNAEGIAKVTGLQPRKVGELIRKRLGIKATQYINTLRVEEAARLLRGSDLQVGQIAYKVGFNTPGHFNRVFKEAKGKAPKEFREAAGGADKADRADQADKPQGAADGQAAGP